MDPNAWGRHWRDLPEIHVSDVTAFLRCRRAWNWSSRLRSNLEPIRPYSPFVLGRAVHEAAEKLHASGNVPTDSINTFFDEELAVLTAAHPGAASYLADDAGGGAHGPVALAKAASDEEWLSGDATILTSASLVADDLRMLEEQRELALGMLEHLAAWEKRQRGPFSLANLEFLTLEQDFKVPIVHPLTGEVNLLACFAGRWDGLVRRRDNGDVYIWELKTTKSIGHRAKMLSNDIQCSYYLNAARMAFPELAGQLKGMLYTLMAKRLPKAPKVLNSGMLSTDIRGQSFESYVAWCDRHHGLRDTMTDDERRTFLGNNYGAPLLALRDSTLPDNIFFERHVVARNATALERAAQDLWDQTANMTNAQLSLYPTPDYSCSWCLFYEPCIALQNGEDADSLLKTLYRNRTQHAGDSDADDDTR